MLSILYKTLSTGVVTEQQETAPELESLGIQVKQHLDKHFNGSIAIRQVDAGSCNACELEIHALNNPYYDIERFGVHFVASPRHADVLLVTGVVSRHMQTALLRTWNSVPEPKYLIASGDCASTGGEIGENYASCGAVANVLPVDVKIAGCPPTPVQLMQGILALNKG